MPLEILTDRFDNATHDGLDTAVNETVEEDITDAEDLSVQDHVQLLNAIVAHSKDMDRKYLDMKEAKKLIKTHGELRAMLASAWKHKSYREIRNLGACLRFLSIIYLLTSFRSCRSHSQSTETRARATSIRNSGWDSSGFVLPISPSFQKHGLTFSVRSTQKLVRVL